MKWWKGGYVHRGQGEIDSGQYEDEADVKCATTGMLINTSFFQDIGMVDWQHFPHYRGDIDFTYRAYKKGYRIIYQPRSKVWHKLSSTGKKTGIATQRSFLKSPISTLVYALSKRSRGGSLSLREIARFHLRHYPLALPYTLVYYVVRHFLREIRGEYTGRYY